MAIDDEEAGRLISTILQAVSEGAPSLERSGVNEVINQWRAEIEAGRPIERKLRVRQSPGLDVVSGTPRSGSSSTGEFVGKEEYSKIEQLDLLVEALGLAFSAPQMMASRFLDTIIKYSSPGGDKRPEQISAVLVDGSNPDVPGRSIDRGVIAQSEEATARLVELLNELSQEGDLQVRKFTLPKEER